MSASALVTNWSFLSQSTQWFCWFRKKKKCHVSQVSFFFFLICLCDLHYFKNRKCNKWCELLLAKDSENAIKISFGSVIDSSRLPKKSLRNMSLSSWPACLSFVAEGQFLCVRRVLQQPWESFATSYGAKQDPQHQDLPSGESLLFFPFFFISMNLQYQFLYLRGDLCPFS